MKPVHLFIAFRIDSDGDKLVIGSDYVYPGTTDLFRFIRDFGADLRLGRYRRLDLNIDSPTLGYHLFEHGIVKIKTVPSR